MNEETEKNIRILLTLKDEALLAELTRSDLDMIYKQVYGFSPPSYMKTKLNVLHGIRSHFRALDRADAFNRM